MRDKNQALTSGIEIVQAARTERIVCEHLAMLTAKVRACEHFILLMVVLGTVTGEMVSNFIDSLLSTFSVYL